MVGVVVVGVVSLLVVLELVVVVGVVGCDVIGVVGVIGVVVSVLAVLVLVGGRLLAAAVGGVRGVSPLAKYMILCDRLMYFNNPKYIINQCFT